MPRKPTKPAAKNQVRAASKAAPSKGKAEAVVAEPAAPTPAPKPTEVKLSAAKGRPMLQWVGKKPLSRVTAFPAQLAETFDPSCELQTANGAQRTGNLYYGDNKEVLAHLLANGYRGKVDLIYIDPPFDSGADYVRKVTLRGKSALAKLEGESYSLGEQVQYTDIWANDNYLQFMYERLILLKELLREGGALLLHCDTKRVHLLRCVLDEVFGSDFFQNEIARVKCNPKNSKRKGFGNIHDLVLLYTKGDPTERTWNPQKETPDSEDLERLFNKVHPVSGRKYTTVALHARGTRRGETGKPWKGLSPPPGRHWAYVHASLDEFDHQKLIEWSSTGNPRLIRYADEKDGDLVQDIWTMKDPEEDGYPTEKPEELIGRFIQSCTNPNGLVLDCFIGSGTTAAAAQKLGRRWIGCDINKGAIQTTSKRLQGIIRQQLAEQEQAAAKAKGDLFGGEADGRDAVTPCAFSFRSHRVNDYDMAIQHNEAVALACEHIGVQRTKTDSYFDGTQGKRLVKIIPFNHPLSPTDLEQLKGELKAREKEERDILLVCLGKELACESWLADWSRLRKRGDVPNKIEVIELRTDPKYGKFMTHTPASAKVSVKRKGGELHVTLEDFTSPTIIERLDSQDIRLFKAHVTDWRFLVDCVMIDPAYDGQSFNIALTDLPEKKTDLVNGGYTLPAPEGKTTVAVKIVDMLGEEVFVTAEV